MILELPKAEWKPTAKENPIQCRITTLHRARLPTDASNSSVSEWTFTTHSDRSILAGLVLAPRTIWMLTVLNAISNKMKTGITNKSHCSPIRKAKLSSHESIPNHVNGRAIKLEINTSLRNCHDKSERMLCTDAPNTFLIPISLSFCVVVNEASPHKPRQAMMMANMAKRLKILANCWSSRYWLLKKSSKK